MTIPLRLRSLSRGGAGVLAPAVLPPDGVHEFFIDLGGEAFVSRARVRRCRPADRAGNSEIGIEFTEMSARDVSRLERYLVEHDVSAAPIAREPPSDA
jgi:c-di-GMP-binding flagellar brake protein YcgR